MIHWQKQGIDREICSLIGPEREGDVENANYRGSPVRNFVVPHLRPLPSFAFALYLRPVSLPFAFCPLPFDLAL
jgi:hypothetical protein